MAITITKEPYPEIYPAYNDSFIEFSSNLADNYKAEILVPPIATFPPDAFIIYADSAGTYLFNVKESMKAQFNVDGFRDANFFTDAYVKSFTNLYIQQTVNLKVLSDISSESVERIYEFFKSLKQVGENEHSNLYQLLTYSEDGVTHRMTYFEGWPFHFDIKRILYSAGRNVDIRNETTGQDRTGLLVTETGSFRINIDRGGGSNWGDGFFPLNEGLNHLRIFEDDITEPNFKSNLYLTKKVECSGVYLKWWNSQGGYSHWLFNEYYINQVQGQDLGLVQNTDFNNIEDVIGFYYSIGKEASRTFVVKTRYDADEYQVLKDILLSPLVQIYTEFNANVTGKFIDVRVNGSMRYNNKRRTNELTLNVELPETVTAKL